MNQTNQMDDSFLFTTLKDTESDHTREDTDHM